MTLPLRFRAVALPILLVAAVAVHGQQLSSSNWLEDVSYFRKEFPKRHMNAFHNVPKEEFFGDVDKLLAYVPHLKEHEIIVRLMQITAKVGDGHSRVHITPLKQRYPAVFNWFDDELRVIATTPEYKQLLGAQLAAIDGHSMEEIKQRISTVVSQDENKWYWMNSSAGFLSVPEVVQAVGLATNVEQASFIFKDSLNNEVSAKLPTILVDPSRQWVTASKTTPLFRQQQNNPFWFTYLGDLKAVYVNFKKYDNLNKDADALFDFVKASKAERLIVDLRANGGGDFFKGRKHLINRIKEIPVLNQKGHLFVITGRRTFSAAMVNSIDFKKDTNAIIIGEPPGEKPNSYSENDEMKLPNSGLVLSYSIRYYKFLDQDVDAFEPDVRIDPTWEAFHEGRDPVMEWIYDYCKKAAANTGN
jgi:hypothetical protein